MFSLVSKTNVIVFQKGSDVFWTSRSRWERHFLSPTYGVHQPLRILWCIRHKQFLNMLAYFIWMCFLNTLQERISLSLPLTLLSCSVFTIFLFSHFLNSPLPSPTSLIHPQLPPDQCDPHSNFLPPYSYTYTHTLSQSLFSFFHSFFISSVWFLVILSPSLCLF